MADKVTTFRYPYTTYAYCDFQHCNWYIEGKTKARITFLAKQHCKINNHVVFVEQSRKETHHPL